MFCIENITLGVYINEVNFVKFCHVMGPLFENLKVLRFTNQGNGSFSILNLIYQKISVLLLQGTQFLSKPILGKAALILSNAWPCLLQNRDNLSLGLYTVSQALSSLDKNVGKAAWYSPIQDPAYHTQDLDNLSNILWYAIPSQDKNQATQPMINQSKLCKTQAQIYPE